jgi:predicted esterase
MVRKPHRGFSFCRLRANLRDLESMQTIERTIQATIHGRYLVTAGDGGPVRAAIVGFHGYGESAATQMERLQSITGAAPCPLISIQGLHRFYRGSSNEVVASWMTKQDRELAIADNISYVGGVIESVLDEYKVKPPLLLAGFSQGVSMAFRAAVSSMVLPAAVVAVGGDVPPEIQPEALQRLSAVLLCRGRGDPYYSSEKFRDDEARLTGAGVSTRLLEFEGGHIWPRDLDRALPQFMRECFRVEPANEKRAIQ